MLRVRLIAAMCLLAVTSIAGAADLEVEQLRRDVRDLERTVAAQSRRIDELERALGRIDGQALPPLAATRAASDEPPDGPAWLAADRWEQLEIDMPAQEVLEVLGEPTAVRIGSTPGERVLLYTLELDDYAFLSGLVRVIDDRVTAVERPTLK